MSRRGGAVVVLAVIVGACSSGGGAIPSVVDASADASIFLRDASDASGEVGDEAASLNCDAGSLIIQASNYDQSCTTDVDCVAVGVGNTQLACAFPVCTFPPCVYPACVFHCAGLASGAMLAAINKTAQAQYMADVANSPAGGIACDCPALIPLACCNGGACSTNCPVPTIDAATDGSADAGNAVDAAVDADAERGAGRVPVNHRPSDTQCSTPAPPGDCGAPYPGGGCASDSDCIEAGTNGRCINPGGGPAAPCFCTYDRCIVDTDCPSGQTCACHGAPYTDARGNTCVQGNCRVDADCGVGGYCSPSSLTGICGDSLAGYYCHAAADLCIDDSDCPESPTVVGSPGCVYSTTDSRWECLVVPVCG